MSVEIEGTRPGRPHPALEEPRLAVGTAWLAAARIGSQVLLVVFTLVIARRMGGTGLGQYAFLAAALWLANTLTTFGTDTILIRDLAARGGSLAATALALQLGLSVLLIPLGIVGTSLWSGLGPDLALALRVSLLALIPLAPYGVLSAALRAHQRMDLHARLTLVGAFVQTSGLLLLLRPSPTVVQLAYLLLGVHAFGAGYAYLLCRRHLPEFRFRSRVSWLEMISLARSSASLGVLSGLSLGYQRLSIYILFFLAGEAVTGWFSAAQRVVESLKVVHNSFSGALLPVLGLTAAGGLRGSQMSQARERARFSWWAIGLAALAGAIGLSILAEPVTQVLYGAGFAASAGAMRILGWSLVPFTVNASQSLSWIARGKTSRVVWVQATGLAVLAGLSFAWIPAAGLEGACSALLVAEGSQALVYVLLASRMPSLSISETFEATRG